MEHLQHFGLTQDPFQNDPDLRFYVESQSHLDAQRRVERGLRQAKGLTVLTGEAGSGRSLLTRRILESLEEELFEACLVVAVKGSAGSGSFTRRIARQLDVAEPAEDPAALLGQVYEALAVVREDGRHAVLMIDEAHALSAEAFSEVASLLNLEYEDRRLLSILLVGPPDFDDQLADESGLHQRIDVRVRLLPMSLEDAGRYLSHRITTVGGGTEILPQETISALYKYGRGRPRLMNTLADNALFEAFLGGRPAISPLDIERAAADLGVGEDPGTTYSQVPDEFAPPSDAASSVLNPQLSAGLDLGASLGGGAGEGSDVLGELTDPANGLSLELGESMDALDIDAPPAPGEVAMTRVHLGDELEDENEVSEIELDNSLDAIQPDPELLPKPDADLPAFKAENEAEPVEADVTQLGGAEDDSALAGGPDDGEIDDLFVELLED